MFLAVRVTVGLDAIVVRNTPCVRRKGISSPGTDSRILSVDSISPRRSSSRSPS